MRTLEDSRIEVLRRAMELAGGDRDRALHWFYSAQLPPFEGLTAADLVSRGRADDVLRFLDGMEAGPVG